MRHQFVFLALAPLLLAQGHYTRRTTPLLPEPPGERSGRRGEGPPLRMLLIGDSAAAGVGAAHQDSALLGQLVQALCPNYRLHWELHAKTGATTASTLSYLAKLQPRTFDLVVTSLGVNDVTGNLKLGHWRSQQREIRRQFRERFSARLMVVSGLPPMGAFPGLPQPLRWYLGRRAQDFNRDLEADIETEPDACMPQLNLNRDDALMAPDGFHPGPGIYSEWARQVASLVRDRF